VPYPINLGLEGNAIPKKFEPDPKTWVWHNRTPKELGSGRGVRPKLLRSRRGCHAQWTWVLLLLLLFLLLLLLNLKKILLLLKKNHRFDLNDIIIIIIIIIIVITSIILFLHIIIIIIIIIIIMIIKFEKKISLLLKKNHKFYLKVKIKNYKNLGHACLILLLVL